MSQVLDTRLAVGMDRLRRAGNLRTLPRAQLEGRHVIREGRRLLNLCSNDYLGLIADRGFVETFFDTLSSASFTPGATASRLLGGNSGACRRLEANLADRYRSQAALVFSSGYHANMGILPALADRHTEIFADKRVHASLIDGIRLSGARAMRYPHNDLARLREWLAASAGRNPDGLRVIVTESLFSMDGDVADLPALAAIRREFPNVVLYVDEAHAVGVRGPTGLGLAEEAGVLDEIDMLVGTFGKALASVGAYVIASRIVCDWLVNTMRTFVFTTALPPVSLMWSDHVLSHLPDFADRRVRVAAHGAAVAEAVRATGGACSSTSHIVPWVLGSSPAAQVCSQALAAAGYHALPIRPPTVPEGTARIRFSLTAAMREDDVAGLCAAICRGA